ncbi:MAG: response regulator [Bacteroidales bacterium]|nr:response regulator [Bacteroidales bacterium]MBN2821116.1 response regulator [Bacteroidales bacterium]
MNFNWKDNLVLIAEDDPINFRYLELLLSKRTGIQILWAKDGREAYEKAINHSGIDIFLLDLQLPELNGIDVLKLVKKANPHLPIIMQTANSWNDEEKACYDAGCDGFFPKPLDINLLLQFIDDLLKVQANNKTVKQTVV